MDSVFAHVFEAVRQVVGENQAYFNAVDEINHNHGDHMLEIFDLAVQTLRDLHPDNPADAMPTAEMLTAEMLTAGLAIKKLEGNGSARVYGDGLIAFAQKLEQREIGQAELIQFVREKTGVKHLEQNRGDERFIEEEGIHDDRSGQVLKALVEGLSAWKQMDSGLSAKGRNLDMSALFELGIIYMQAKQHGGSKIKVLADAAVSASPLNQSAHRKLSGKIVIQAMLEALATYESGDSIT
jgi:hypothetical protein